VVISLKDQILFALSILCVWNMFNL